MMVHTLDPLTDPRWPEFLQCQPGASIFHTRGWLRALQLTYGYEPVAFTTSPAGMELSNAVVFCQIKSWLTGRRLVSLPFSDHCQPLASGRDLKLILQSVSNVCRVEDWKYIELRPVADNSSLDERSDFGVGEAFSLHTIDLRQDLETIYRRFHESCVRRKIKRAEREKLTFESGNSEQLLDKFRHLLLLTRRRHKLPPQPTRWFRNLIRCLGDQLTIQVLSKDADPVGSIITLTYKKSVVYKYGCSDAQFHNFGAMPLLFWKTIQHGKQSGAEQFDLGRSGPDDPGLIAFKGHLGAVASDLKYYRYPFPHAKTESSGPKMFWARQVLARLPEPLLVSAGQLLYRHLG